MVTRVTVGVTASLLLCLLLLSIWFDYYIHFLNHFVQNIYEIVKVELSLPSYDYRCKIDHGDSYNPIASSSKVNLNRYAKLRLSIIDDSFSSFDLDSTTPKRSTNYYRCLPNILFIGASKCGTTSLTDYLDSHEEVFFVNRHVFRHDTHREVHRFDRRDYAWTQFGSLGLAQEWASSPLLKTPQQPLIHYTPHYLYAPTVPLEVSRFYPRSQEMRFVVVLRDPVDRAVSAYWFQQSHLFTASGRDKGSWADFEAQVDGDIIKR